MGRPPAVLCVRQVCGCSKSVRKLAGEVFRCLPELWPQNTRTRLPDRGHQRVESTQEVTAMPFDTKETLCWKCKRPGTNSCSWDKSRGRVPVEGWNADQCAFRDSDGTYGSSYRVNECPLFVLDEDYVRRMKEHAAQNKRGPRPTVDRSEVDNLIRYGWTDRAIALRFGLSINTVKSYRHRRAAAIKRIAER